MISTITEMRYGVALEKCLARLRTGLDLRPAFRHHRPERARPDNWLNDQLDDGPGDRQESDWQYGIKYLFSENLALPVDAAIEVLESVRHAKEDSGPGGFGVEQRLGHRLVRSRSPAALGGCLSALGAGAAQPTLAMAGL